MTARCSHCSRPVLSRPHGAVKILAMLSDVDECDIEGTITDPDAMLVSLRQVKEIRELCSEMICWCERSVAEAEAA